MFLNIHNLVRVELVNETKEMQQVLRYHAGTFEANLLNEDPDIRIRFTNHIELEEKVRFIDTETAYGDGALYIIRNDKKVSILPKTLKKPRYNIICEAGFNHLELYHLMFWFFVQHVLLEKGTTFIHTAAVFFKNRGLLFPAWRDAGKTGMTLAFLKEGAEYISDDLPIVTQDGTILANPIPLNLSRYLLAPLLKKTRFRDSHYKAIIAKKAALSIMGAILQKIPLKFIREVGGEASQRARQLEPIVSVPFSSLLPQGKIRKSTPLDAVFFLTSRGSGEIEIEEANDKFFTDRISYSLLYETNSVLRGLYEFLRIAFPEWGEALMQERETKPKEIITQAFKGKQLYYVNLPWHFDLGQAFNKIMECL